MVKSKILSLLCSFSMFGATVFDSQNWSSETELGDVSFNPASIVISGPQINNFSIRSSTDGVLYNQSVNANSLIIFDWNLNSRNSLLSAASFLAFDSNSNLIYTTTLASTVFGGNRSGAFQYTMPQSGFFGYSLDTVTYKGRAADFTIENLVIIPEFLGFMPIALIWVFILAFLFKKHHH